ncbi:MAG: ATP-dependent zinc metalloprotease FtsH [Spirochaetaceae bacterium]|jgi:cell division protease FtsH|nr:ATP-dependent zinc metalloprotease FtsH [Spirochaetaceae bacterium]
MNNNLPQGNPDGLNKNFKPNYGLLFFLVALAALGFFYMRSASASFVSVAYTDFINLLNDESRKPVTVTIVNNEKIEWRDRGAQGTEVHQTIIPYNDPALLPLLEEKGIRVVGAEAQISWLRLVLEILPWLIGFCFVIMIIRSMQANAPGGRGFNFGKSRAKRYDGQGKKITFADVAGQNEAKTELQEVVSFLKDPDKFTKMGAKIPKGVLLVGMPGTGKTLMARAVAGEAGVDYFHMSGSDFVEMFVGVGASRVRDLFEQGRKHSPCIIFIDELDAVGRVRGAGYGGGHDEREQTLNQMLVEMDGFDSKEGIIILAATNRPDVLDPALLRPGRFDRQVVIAMPDINERKAILTIHSKKVKIAEDVDLSRVARATPGMSGADLANLVNESALLAARKDKKSVEMTDFEDARDKILMGVARTTLAISEKERKMTAVHEAGHALLHYFLPNSDPLHKVTIIPHGRALGMAISLPEEDSFSRTKGWIEDRISICYGGWLAEKLIYNETTTGTQQDLAQATEMARNMVCEWGMSDEIGPITFGQEDKPIFIGKEIARHKDYSEETSRHIDGAIKRVLDEARERAGNILTTHRQKLEKLSDTLFERETLIDNEVRRILDLPEREDKLAMTKA